MTCEQCYVCEQTVLQCSRTMLLAMTYDLCHGGHMVAEYPLLHTPCPSPPLVLPRGVGGPGDRHLVNPKFFVAAHCVVVWVTVLWATATCIPCTQDILLTFAEMELDSTTMFPPETNVMFIRSTGEPVSAQVVGHSEHSDAYRRITYERDGKTVLHDVRLFVYGGSAVPQGGWGTVT